MKPNNIKNNIARWIIAPLLFFLGMLSKAYLKAESLAMQDYVEFAIVSILAGVTIHVILLSVLKNRNKQNESEKRYKIIK